MLRKSLSLVLFAFASNSAPAALVINVQEVGTDVVVTASGSLDLTGATFDENVPAIFLESELRPNKARLNSQSSPTGADRYELTGGAAGFGTGSTVNTAILSSSGDTFGFEKATLLYVPGGYISGGAIIGTMTVATSTFASLGMTPGSYTWTIPSDSITLNVGAVTPVPEPATYIALAGFGGLGVLVWRRRKRVKRAADTLNR